MICNGMSLMMDFSRYPYLIDFHYAWIDNYIIFRVIKMSRLCLLNVLSTSAKKEYAKKLHRNELPSLDNNTGLILSTVSNFYRNDTLVITQRLEVNNRTYERVKCVSKLGSRFIQFIVLEWCNRIVEPVNLASGIKKRKYK